MDSKIMDLINLEIKRLPARGRVEQRDRQYVDAKQILCKKFPGEAEGQYIGKALARKYGI